MWLNMQVYKSSKLNLRIHLLRIGYVVVSVISMKVMSTRDHSPCPRLFYVKSIDMRKFYMCEYKFFPNI